MAQPRFLIGFGERLTEPIPPPRRNMERSSPYTLAEARSRLAPLVNEAASLARQLPDLACPEGFVVSKMTLHPSYIAKTSYPGHLLRAADLTAVGSRPAHVIPSRVVRSRKGTDGEREFHAVPGVEPRATTELFVAGLRSDLDSWAKALSDTDSPLDPDNDQLVQLESFALPTAEEIRYAMVITADAPKMPDLYDRVLRTYATQLEALSPVVDIPIRLQG